jgi:hypothetical protein
MPEVIESGIGTLNYGPQSAKGTKATAATTSVGYNRPRWVSGVLTPQKKSGEEEYIDGQRFGSPSQYTDSIGDGASTIEIQAQPENAGLFLVQVLNVDTVTGGTDPYTHTITSAGTSGKYGSWWQKVGSAVGPERELYWDSKIAKIDLKCGRDQKFMHYGLDIMALKSAEVYTTDAAKTEDTSDPWLWTEMTGTATFDSTVVPEINGENLTIDTGGKLYFGDDVFPLLFVEGKGTITRTFDAVVTDTILGKFRKVIYGTASPTAGTLPVKDVFKSSFSTLYTRSVTRTLSITTPNVAVKPDGFAIGPQAAGGEIPISFGGSCLKSGATPALTVVALTGDATSY